MVNFPFPSFFLRIREDRPQSVGLWRKDSPNPSSTHFLPTSLPLPPFPSPLQVKRGPAGLLGRWRKKFAKTPGSLWSLWSVVSRRVKARCLGVREDRSPLVGPQLFANVKIKSMTMRSWQVESPRLRRAVSYLILFQKMDGSRISS